MTPMISCVMVTRGRPAMAARATKMFLEQSWARKELVAVVDVRGYPGSSICNVDIPLSPWDHRNASVRLIAPPPADNYAQLRNLGIAKARGDVVCLWDDDDLHHHRRLEVQHAGMVAAGADACFFSRHFHHDKTTGRIRWVSYPSGLPGAMMCRRSAAPHFPDGPGPEGGRDSPMRDDLVARVKTVMLPEGYVYTYTYHGGNLWSHEHHQRLAANMVPHQQLAANFPVLQRHLGEMGIKVDRWEDLIR